MMGSGENVAVEIISSLDALSYVLYNLDNIKDGCSMSEMMSFWLKKSASVEISHDNIE